MLPVLKLSINVRLIVNKLPVLFRFHVPNTLKYYSMAGKQPRILSCKRTLLNAMKVPITKVHVSDIDS